MKCCDGFATGARGFLHVALAFVREMVGAADRSYLGALLASQIASDAMRALLLIQYAKLGRRTLGVYARICNSKYKMTYSANHSISSGL